MKLKINLGLCIGCGACSALAPETFSLDQEACRAKVIKEPKSMTKEIEMALEGCPVGAIEIKGEK